MPPVLVGPLPAVAVLGAGTAFPALELTNEDVLRGLPGADGRPPDGERLRFLAEGLRESMGVWRRAWAHPVGGPLDHDAEESTLDLAVRASRRALADAGLAASQLSLVVCSTSTPHRMTGTLSAALGAALGASAACMDARAGCAGGLFGLTTSALYLGAGAGPVLLVGAETFSRIIPPESREARVSLGDGAAALVLGRRPSAALLGAFLETDGALGRLITTEGALPPTEDGIARGDYRLSGAPGELSAVVPAKYQAALAGALGRAGVAPWQIDLFVPHQTSEALLRAVCARAGIPPGRAYLHVERHANIGAAGWMAALAEARGEGRCQPGMRIAVAAVGGGMSWGAAVLQC